ncbi:MAG: preprotein translocase subunit SecE [Clostridia bacterium]|nr:preprotein translocase subunit SecE [Clostridia bacterium]
MADEKKAPKAAAEKTSWFSKVLTWCKNLPKNIAAPFKNMINELKLVTWPTKRQLIIYSAIVLVFMLFMMIVIGAFDLGSSSLVRALRFNKPAAVTETVPEAAEAVEETAETAAEAVEETAAAAEEAASEAVEETAAAVEETAATVTEAAEEAAEGEAAPAN